MFIMIRKERNSMNDQRIIKMYNQGFSVDYISKVYCKYKNRNLKPIIVPVKLYTKHDCILYVSRVIYSYIINKDTVDAQTVS